MATLVLAIYLILIGIVGLASVDLPSWLLPVLALIAGVLFLLERFGLGRKP